MKQSKIESSILCLFCPFLWCLCTLFFGKNFTLSWDAIHTYAPMIDTNYICDWHSDLFIFEGILLKNIFTHFLSPCANGIFCVHIILWISFFLVLSIPSLWAHRFTENKIILLIILLALYYFTQNILFSIGTLDTICLAPAFLALEASYQIKHCSDRNKTIFWYGLLFISIIHLISFRKNAIIPVMVLFYWLFSSSCIKNTRSYRLTISAIISILFYAFSTSVIGFILQSEKGYPLIPLLASHICTERTLCNNDCQNTLWEPSEDAIPIIQGVLFPNLYFTYPFNLPSKAGDKRDQEARKEAYEILKKQLIADSLVHPKESLMAKALHIYLFYTSEFLPSSLVNTLNDNLPHLHLKAKAYKTGLRIFARSRLSLLILCTALCLLCYRKSKKACNHSKLVNFVVLLSAFSLAYLLSFSIFTPSVDYRYSILSIFVSSIAFILFLLSYINKSESKSNIR